MRNEALVAQMIVGQLDDNDRIMQFGIFDGEHPRVVQYLSGWDEIDWNYWEKQNRDRYKTSTLPKTWCLG